MLAIQGYLNNKIRVCLVVLKYEIFVVLKSYIEREIIIQLFI